MKEQDLLNLKIGDVLINKNININRKITVEDITINKKVVCVWFDGNNQPHRELLSPEQLENE